MDIFKTLADMQAQLTKIEQKLDDLKFLTAAGPPPRRNYDHLATAPQPSPPPRPTTPPRPRVPPMNATERAAKEKLDRWIKEVHFPPTPKKEGEF